MSDDDTKMVVKTEIAKPLHYQVLERSLDLEPFLSFVESYLQDISGDEGEASSNSEGELVEVNAITGETIWNGIAPTREDRRLERERYYNLSKVKENRKWLQDVLVSDTSESSDSEVTEEDLRNMLKEHLVRRKYRRKFCHNPKNRQYMYYSSGLLSTYDKFPEHQSEILGVSKKKKSNSASSSSSVKKEKPKKTENVDSDTNLDDSLDYDLRDDTPPSDYAPPIKSRPSKKKAQRSFEALAAKRRKLWALMAKKEIGKVQRSKLNNHKEMLTSCRRVANNCMRHCRQKAMQSQKNMKEVIWRTKKLSKEMQAYWKRYERVERETRKRLVKEAEEQRKLNVEIMEAKRQQRKLNFLITQTELYAHFMSKKLGGGSEEEQLRILSQLEEEHNPRLAPLDDYDCEIEKERLLLGVERSVAAEAARAKEFGVSSLEPTVHSSPDQDLPQPAMFSGKLKAYQLKGMTWLAKLYDQGINGILADEMGLGKTVQSIAFLCHIAERYSVWGPFLIVSPASTLHNWQQEMARFVPDFKVVPYWGNQQDRKILRTFWDLKDIHTKDASFHVVITSYQFVITDIKYFNRIKWQYMILDEAQAIKNTASMRWKLLLGFNCRNRLLLSGTPIQNSMAELWALLHFIMPTMFDSHDEFNEWFSKDIESHAENKTGIDEKHLSRLHMILKPFMLRRVKADVENELSDKIEIMLYCPLTTRQQQLYSALKKKIRIEDLFHSSGSYQTPQSITTNLMNIVMQFRKVCNHPELFERSEPRSPFFMKCEDYIVPKLITDEGLLHDFIPSKKHLVYNILSIFSPYNIHSSIFHPEKNEISAFSFLRLMDMSPMELFRIALCGLIFRWMDFITPKRKRIYWKTMITVEKPDLPEDFLFTSMTKPFFSHETIAIHSTPETIEHRILRSKKASAKIIEILKNESGPIIETGGSSMSANSDLGESGSSQSASACGSDSVLSMSMDCDASGSTDINPPQSQPSFTLVDEFPYRPRPTRLLRCWPTSLPSFIVVPLVKVGSGSRQMYSYSRRWAWRWYDHQECGGQNGKQAVMHGAPWLDPARQPGFSPTVTGGVSAAVPPNGWSNIVIPDKQSLVTDSGKLTVLDCILKRLKEEGHRVLIYSQMTRMIDLLEVYMWYRKHTFMRLDGSSKISDRRDMVADFQNRTDIFVFLLSTRAGGLGINLTAADTVIFYDSDWNPTVDQQAMDRAHRLGQTKQVTVYRLICKDTIEERILQRAREKSEIQRMVISGGNFKSDSLKHKEVVSLLLDDAEIEEKYRQKKEERRLLEEQRLENERRERERKRKLSSMHYKEGVKHIKNEDGELIEVYVQEGSQEPNINSPTHVAEGELGSQQSTSSEDPSLRPKLSERVRGKRGRPPIQASRRGTPGRPIPLSQMLPISVNTKNLPSYSGPLRGRRGRGRPRLKPGPSSHHLNRAHLQHPYK